MTTNQALPELTTVPVFIVLDEDPIIHTDDHPYCDDETCPCQDDREQETPDDMAQSEAWLARQAAQHEEDKNYFSQWGLHEEQA